MIRKYVITGMSCTACSSNIENKVKKLKGIKSCTVNLMNNFMIVDYNEKDINDEIIIITVKKLGYGINIKGDKFNKLEASERKTKIRLIFSLIIMIVVMYVSMGHMLKLPLPSFLEGLHNTHKLVLLQLLLTIPVIILNRNYYVNGYKNLFKLNPNMDSLIALSSSAAFIYGCATLIIIWYNLVNNNLSVVEQYQHQLYFDSVVMILSLITLGKYLETMAKKKTGIALKKLSDLSVPTAVVLENNIEKVVDIVNIKVSDVVIVKAGEIVSVDGVIINGYGYIDESMITGESIPVYKKVGDNVITGTINTDGYLKICVKYIGQDTTLAKIIELVENANVTKAPIAKIADKIANIFVPSVLFISIITFILWGVITKDWELAFNFAITVLIISCPCALGLATPVAIMMATGKGAEHGILIKSSEALETTHLIDTIVLDKTGTITKGKIEIVEIVANNIKKDKLIQIASSLEYYSSHPIAKAIVDYANDNKIEIIEASDYKSISGLGISGKIDDTTYYIGNISYIEKMCNNTLFYEKQVLTNKQLGQTFIIVATNDMVLGIISVADSVRETSLDAIKKLKKSGIEVIMLTGDNQKTADSIAKAVEINTVIAEVLPDEKEKHVKRLIDEGKKVMFVGDGINDAPALTRAHVGVAIGAGTGIAIECADIILIKNNLLDIVTLYRLSKVTIRNIKENLFWAFFYNVLGIPIAAGLFYSWLNLKLNPMIASIAMSISSICVVCNALRLHFFKESKEEKSEMKYYLEVCIEGMMCNHCQKRVEDAINSIDGVFAKVDLEQKTAFVESKSYIEEEKIRKIIENLGYKVSSIKK